MKPTNNIFKIIWNSITTDVDTVKHIFKSISDEKSPVDLDKLEELKMELKKLKLSDIIKEYWLWLICIIFAGVMGWVLAASYYQVQCNNYIIDNCMQTGIDLIKLNLSS